MISSLGEIACRPFVMEDAEALLSWAKSADELLQWTGPRFRFPLDEHQLAEYANTDGEHRHVISAVAADGAVVGHAELTVIPEHELGQIGRFGVAPQARGQGVAGSFMRWLVSLAFEELQLHRLELVVFSFNEPAIRCYQRRLPGRGPCTSRTQGKQRILGSDLHGDARARAYPPMSTGARPLLRHVRPRVTALREAR